MKGKLATLESIVGQITALESRLNGRFDGIDERFCSIDQRFERADKRMDSFDVHFAASNARFAILDRRFDELTTRFDSLTITVEELAEATNNGFSAVERRFEKIEAVLATKADKDDVAGLEACVGNLENGFRHFDGRLTNLEAQGDSTAGSLRQINLKIDDLRDEVNGFASDIYDELSGRMDRLETKIA